MSELNYSYQLRQNILEQLESHCTHESWRNFVIWVLIDPTHGVINFTKPESSALYNNIKHIAQLYIDDCKNRKMWKKAADSILAFLYQFEPGRSFGVREAMETALCAVDVAIKITSRASFIEQFALTNVHAVIKNYVVPVDKFMRIIPLEKKGTIEIHKVVHRFEAEDSDITKEDWIKSYNEAVLNADIAACQAMQDKLTELNEKV